MSNDQILLGVVEFKKIYVCDYQIPRSEELACLIIEAEDDDDAEEKAISELKTLNIPKRYIININEVL